jgi:hypothetical protein
LVGLVMEGSEAKRDTERFGANFSPETAFFADRRSDSDKVSTMGLDELVRKGV